MNPCSLGGPIVHWCQIFLEIMFLTNFWPSPLLFLSIEQFMQLLLLSTAAFLTGDLTARVTLPKWPQRHWSHGHQSFDVPACAPRNYATYLSKHCQPAAVCPTSFLLVLTRAEFAGSPLILYCILGSPLFGVTSSLSCRCFSLSYYCFLPLSCARASTSVRLESSIFN